MATGVSGSCTTRSHEALTLAQDLSHAYSLAFALHFAAVLHPGVGKSRSSRERAEAVIALSSATRVCRIGWKGDMTLPGWALVQQGTVEKGLHSSDQGLDYHGMARGNDLGKTERSCPTG